VSVVERPIQSQRGLMKADVDGSVADTDFAEAESTIRWFERI
jgi:hypothetical protein